MVRTRGPYGAPGDAEMEIARQPIKGCGLKNPAYEKGPRLTAQRLSVRLARANAGEALVELRDLAARINNALLACPGRVRLRVNVQADGIARLAVAGTGLVLGPVGHDDVDLMISGMDIGLHGACSQKWAADADRLPWERRL